MPLVGATYIFPKNRIEVEKIGMDYTIQYRNKYGAAQLWYVLLLLLLLLLVIGMATKVWHLPGPAGPLARAQPAHHVYPLLLFDVC